MLGGLLGPVHFPTSPAAYGLELALAPISSGRASASSPLGSVHEAALSAAAKWDQVLMTFGFNLRLLTIS